MTDTKEENDALRAQIKNLSISEPPDQLSGKFLKIVKSKFSPDSKVI